MAGFIARFVYLPEVTLHFLECLLKFNTYGGFLARFTISGCVM